MKIKKIFMFILSVIMITLSSCSQETEQETKSIAENGLNIAETLEGCEVISDIYGLPNVKESQEYNYETDYNPSWIVCNGVTDAKEQLYTNSPSDRIYYYKKEEKELKFLCGKPECEHNSENCNAIIFCINGIQYYNGFLYVVSPEERYMLKKISLDGAERENIGSLFVGKNMIGYNNSGNSIFWIIHRGYIYYTYSASASNGSEDTYYLNNSNYLFRMSLEGNEEPQCIMKLPYMSNLCLKGIGSYVYVMPYDAASVNRNLYRYNTETEKLECMESLGSNIIDCTEKAGLIYYMQTNEDNSKFDLMSFDTDTKQKSEIINIQGQGWSVFHDDDFLYILYGINGFQDMARFYVMDWNYNIIANVELEGSNGHRSWQGTDDKYIYFGRYRTGEVEQNESSKIIEYIEKEDLLDGEYTIKECIY